MGRVEATGSVLRGVDRAAFAVAFATRLRGRGVAVGLTAVDDAVRALGAVSPDSRSRVYWATRVAFVRRQEDLAVFDSVFASVFEDAVLPVDPNARRGSLGGVSGTDDDWVPARGAAASQADGAGVPWATLPRVVAMDDGDDDDDGSTDAARTLLPFRLPSSLADRADRPFDELDPSEVDRLCQWLEAAVPDWPTRRSRRMVPDRHAGRVAMRHTIARARRTGWEPAELVGHRQAERQRRVVMLCDVSQSMQPQALAYLHLMRALALRTDAEVFAFATSLTRLTPMLRHHSATVAVEQASAKVTDRFGGTRIATNLQALLASHHGSAVRGAVVLIASDGWDSDPPEALAAAMRRLRRRAYRVIWVNPRAGAQGFEPRVASMAAALPYCDRLLAAGTFASLAAVVAEIARCSRGPRVVSSTA